MDERYLTECTAEELFRNLSLMMNDPEAQKKWAEELDKQGFWVNFNGPIPLISAKEIHISSKIE